MDQIWHNIRELLEQGLWISLAKVTLGLIMLGLSLVSFYVVLMAGKWHAQLVNLEQTANFYRDELMFQFIVARSRLDEMKGYISRRRQANSVSLNPQVLKSIGSILLLVVRKEKSIVQWGMLIVKLGGSLLNFLKSSGKAKN